MTFLYLVPTGMNDPEQPTWGSWAGRYGRNQNFKDQPYYWANLEDDWQGTLHRDNSLKRWAEHLQNDFRARMDWCVEDFSGANHPPVPRVDGGLRLQVAPGDTVSLDASGSSDPDGDALEFEWVVYPEVGGDSGSIPEIHDATSSKTSFVVPNVESPRPIHLILAVSDRSSPPLTRYARVILNVTQ